MRAIRTLAAGLTGLVIVSGGLCGPVLAADEERGAKPLAEAAQPKAKEVTGLREFHLSGRVLLPDGRPAVGAKVEITLYSRWDEALWRREETKKTALADAQGHYDFGLMAVPKRNDEMAGYGRLVATANGYGFDEASLHFRKGAAHERRALEVLTEDVRYDLKLAPEVTVGGTVCGPDRKPLDGVKVALESVTYGAPWDASTTESAPEGYSGTQTDAQGRFKVRGTPAGARANCVLDKEGYLSAKVSISAEKEADMTLPLAGAVEGKVAYGATGEPARGVPVQAASDAYLPSGPDYYYWGGGSGVTDQEGKFLFQNLSPGSAVVEVPEARLPQGYTAEKLGDVPVKEGETTRGVVLKLIKGGILKGTVVDATTGEPVPGAGLTASRVLGSAWRIYGYGRTDAEGRYTIRLPAGSYSLTCNGPPAYVRDLLPPDRKAMVTVKDGAETEAEALKLRPAAHLTLKVLSPEGRSGAPIVVKFAEFAGSTPGGVNWFALDPSGTTKIDIGDELPGVTLKIALQNAEGTFQGEGQITPKAGEDNELVIRLQKAVRCAVTGKVVGPKGQPIAGAEARLNRLYRPLGSKSTNAVEVGMAKTDARGRFEINGLSPGEDLYITVSATGYAAESSKVFSLSAGKTRDIGTLRLGTGR